ncbi:protein kinase [Candidatus Margulisiibacteriota bacterium]
MSHKILSLKEKSFVCGPCSEPPPLPDYTSYKTSYLPIFSAGNLAKYFKAHPKEKKNRTYVSKNFGSEVFISEKLIGSGSFSKIYRGTFKKNTENSKAIPAAIKVIDVPKKNCTDHNGYTRKDVLKGTFRMVSIMKKLKHENIVTYYQSFYVRQKGRDPDNFFLVMELCEDDNYEKVAKTLEHNVSDIKIHLGYLAQVIRAIQYLHSLGIVHFDLKRNNICFKNGKVKLTDFSESRIAKGKSKQIQSIGNPYYLSPHIFTPPKIKPLRKKDNPKLFDRSVYLAQDVWCIGILIWRALTSGNFPQDFYNLKTPIRELNKWEIPNATYNYLISNLKARKKKKGLFRSKSNPQLKIAEKFKDVLDLANSINGPPLKECFMTISQIMSHKGYFEMGPVRKTKSCDSVITYKK